MVLLLREALRIKGGDKKKAVGLLDEAIRIPYAWIKSIPREALPGSLALDNFLLPGNKEDGADKSRHWNVFGGICLYKSPQEATRPWRSSARCRTSAMTTTPRMRCVSSSGT